MEFLRTDQFCGIFPRNVLGDTVEDQLIALECLQGILMDRVFSSIDPLASVAKSRKVVYPSRSRKEHDRYDNDRDGENPQSPRDPSGGCSGAAQNEIGRASCRERGEK